MNTEQIKNAVEKYHNYIVEMRREFHRYPEVSGKEQHTREILVRELEKWECHIVFYLVPV